MTKKIIMYNIGNQDKFNYYVFEKTQNAFETLAKLFYRIFKISTWEIHNEKTGKKILVKNLTDTHNGFFGKNRLDVFYGKKKMYITILCSKKTREKINKELGRITEMPKPMKGIKPKKKVSKNKILGDFKHKKW